MYYICSIKLNKFLPILMKKIVGLFFVALFFVALLSSCKSHERCPAYGKVYSDSAPKSV